MKRNAAERLERLEREAREREQDALPYVSSVILRERAPDDDPRNVEARRLIAEAEAGRLRIGTVIRIVNEPRTDAG